MSRMTEQPSMAAEHVRFDWLDAGASFLQVHEAHAHGAVTRSVVPGSRQNDIR